MIKTKRDWLVQVLGVDPVNAEVDTSGDGRVGKARGAAYEGEETGATEFAGPRGKRSLQQHLDERAKGYRVTRTFTDEERAEKRVTANETGQFVDRTGQALTKSGEMYTIDAESGEMHIADQVASVQNLDANGNPVGPRSPAECTRQELLAMAGSNGAKRLEVTHHSTLNAAKDVAAAGEISIDNGKVTKISNKSGHYKPKFEHLLQVVEDLLKNGSLLDQDLVDQNNTSVAPNSKAAKFYARLQPLLKKLPADQVKLQKFLDLVKTRARNLDGSNEEGLTDQEIKEAEAVQKRVDTVVAARKILAKMGVGPRNLSVGPLSQKNSAEVEFLSAPKTGTGFDFVTAKPAKLTTREFLMGEDSSTGRDGGRAQRSNAAQKKKVHQELLAKQKKVDPAPEEPNQAPAQDLRGFNSQIDAANEALDALDE